ncbi:hypothetical protein TR51_35440 [Kitasatospora griseola]|uniref:Uncharacterized protein n=1 Tax=Kitasatospora griseola TaxID=2064 RepID=A0A0D0PS72_KITGR|nr:hypothetical protein [Kitasatospora griseola]KIQ61498.1 hypothetical protein TR51_35440 [Kitasatospora griseola]
MFVFVCVACRAELTVALSQVALPVHAHQQYGNGAQLPVLMESGTFAVDPEPSGPPWRRWEEVDPEEAAARGFYAPVYTLSDGAPGAIVIAPGDARGTVLVPERSGGYCCGLGGADGPNMVCEGCGLPVASRIDDCSSWQAVWLEPEAVCRVPVEGTDAAPLSWEELLEEQEGTPPFEPIGRWGSRGTDYPYWSWSPRWEAAAGRALAHLLVASQGEPVTVPDGLVKEVFQRALDALLPAGPSARRAVLAGPGLPLPAADADICLVPAHPQTGEVWTPAGSAYPVSLPFGVWRWLAFPEPDLAVPVSGGMPDGVLRDDPPMPRSPYLFRADPAVFRDALVRLPAVRSPWLRAGFEDITELMRTGLF